MIPAMPESHAWLQPAILIGLDVAAKSLLLLAIGFAATALLTCKQLLTRSAMWNACVLGLLILPISSVALPRLRIPILPAAPVASLPPEPTIAPTDEAMITTEGRTLEPAIPEPSMSVAPDSAPPPPLPTPPKKTDWVLVAILAYAGGAILLALRLLSALFDVRRLRRSAQAVCDPLWRDTLKSWAGRLGIDSPVQLLHSPRVSVPVAFGWLRPAVVIPASMVEAPISARRSCILLHELAHVRRRDYLWQLLLKCAQVLYWPNPLIWLAGRIIAANREEATDALCAYHATNPNEYRLTLLEVAQSLVRRPAAAFGIAMARTPRIAQRLERIDRGVRLPNCLAGRTTRTIVAVTALVVAGVVGASQLASRSLGHDSAKRSESMARMKQIAVDFLLNDTPASLQNLVDSKVITKEMLISPVTPSATQPSYVLVPWRGKRHPDPRDVLLYEHPANYQHRGTIVCYGDAHVEWRDLAGFQKTLAATFERMNRPVPTEYTQEAIDAAVGPAPARTRYFVLLVVGRDKLTFEGRPTTWQELPKLLEQVPNRPSTVFATAVATDEMTLREVNDAWSRAAAIGRKFDFEYFSDTGVKPLGSKGDPPQEVPAPTARPETPRTPPAAPGKTTASGVPRDTLSKETTPKGMMGLMAPSSPPSGAKQPPARAVTQATGPKATLKSGAVVEFLGVHLLPEKDGWWGLDGQPLKEAPCDPGEPRYWDVKKKGDTVTYPHDVREYQFVLQVTGPQGKAEVFPNLIPWINEVPGAKSTFASAVVNRKGQMVFGFRSVQASLPSGREKAKLLIGLASGDWKTRGSSDGTLTGTSRQGTDLLFSAGAEIQGNATISVTDTKTDNATRIIAIDKNGTLHEAPCVNSVGGENSRVTQAIFPNLALREVKEFQFQTCEYEWVSFSGIPLPGPHNTRASASDKPAEKQPAAVSAKQVVQIGGHIARPGVYALPAETKLTVLQLIASAGGTNIDPGEAVVRIQRVDRRNHNLPVVIEGNPLSRFLADPQRDLALQADDVVQILTMKEAEQKPTGAATLPAPEGRGTISIEKDPAARAGTAGKHAIIERTINADASGKDCTIDFDSGRLATPDKSFSGSFPDWFKTSGVDAARTTENAGAGLYGFDMVVAPVAGEAWDKYSQEPFASLVHHVQTGTPGTPAVMSAAGQLPATYLFKTREGGTGVLQILELSNKPDARFLRIRYRMLSAPAGSAGRPAADSGKAPTTTRPAQGEITGLAIVVPRRDSIEQPSGLSPDKKDQYVAELAAHGPDSTSKSGSEYRWFELGNGVSHELGLEGTYDGHKYLLVDARPANAMFTSQGEGSWSITKAAITKDGMGRPAITYSLDDRGAKLLSVLSRNNIGHPAALIAGSRVVTIAVIRSEISKTVQISGNYTETEWRRILAELPVASTAPASEDAAATQSAQQ